MKKDLQLKGQSKNTDKRMEEGLANDPYNKKVTEKLSQYSDESFENYEF